MYSLGVLNRPIEASCNLCNVFFMRRGREMVSVAFSMDFKAYHFL